MSKKDLDRIRELTIFLNRCREEYYNLGCPSISDEVYDRLFDELADAETNLGICMANSPTQTVGYPVISEAAKALHETPLLSLAKTKQIPELLAFCNGRRMLLSLKLDGLTTEVIYEGGVLQRLSTRGNGEFGEDITHNAVAINGIPYHIPYTEKLVVVGESFIYDQDFAQLKDKLVDSTGKQYKNSRNLAAESLHLFNSAVCKERKLSFRPFTVLQGLDDIVEAPDSKRSKLLKLTDLGFDKIPCIIFTYADAGLMNTFIARLQNKAREDGYPIDGLVLTYDEIAYSKSCGRTGHHFKDGLAYKFEDDLAVL